MFRCQSRLVCHVIRTVTGTALQSGMFSFETIACKRVIELILSVGPPDKVDVFTQVLDVTGNAVGVFFVGMESLAGSNPVGKYRVAPETFSVVDLLTCRMTLLAVFQSLQIRMCPLKLAGGELTERRRYSQ